MPQKGIDDKPRKGIVFEFSSWKAHLHPMFMILDMNHCASLGWELWKVMLTMVFMLVLVVVVLVECIPGESCFP